jgi:glycosyltransferase involved in cell wall biosynthesis
MKLVVTIPAQNEEKTIAQVVRGVPRDIDGIDDVEVIVVNDGSTDRTAAEALEAGATVINVSGRPGLGRIFRTGFERAMRRGADVIVNIDGDGQFNPADIRLLVQPILRDEADFVTCSRFANPAYRPTMPTVKYYGNQIVTRMINWICGSSSFTDVSCGFRAFSREAAYRLTLFGRYTYTQECFIDLFGKGVRIAEVPLLVRGVREHGKSRVASSIVKYATNSFPIILRAMRDIQPLKFFGGIAMFLLVPGFLMAAFMAVWYMMYQRTSPWRSVIPISGVLLTLGFLMLVMALLADMLGRHRRISEDILYLMRRRMYSKRRGGAGSGLPVVKSLVAAADEAKEPQLTLHDTWGVHVITPEKPAPREAETAAAASHS